MKRSMYNHGLQRFLAVVLAALFSVPLIAPLLSAQSEAKLPACCRRDGSHGCAMSAKADASAKDGVNVSGRKAVCPLFQSGQPAPASAKANVSTSANTVIALVADCYSAIAQTEALYRISFNRASQKRGPPLS